MCFSRVISTNFVFFFFNLILTNFSIYVANLAKIFKKKKKKKKKKTNTGLRTCSIVLKTSGPKYESYPLGFAIVIANLFNCS